MTTITAISTPAGRGGIAIIRISGPEAVAIAGRFFAGPKALAECPERRACLGTFKSASGTDIDQCVFTRYAAPRSFTGEDMVEISCHGSAYVQRAILQILIDGGCRGAGAGEFTKRAFLNGKMDLSQAEAVADLIASDSAAAGSLALRQLRGGISSELKVLRERLLDFASLIELELDFSDQDVEFADRGKLEGLAAEIEDKIGTLCAGFKTGSAIKNGIPAAIVGETNAGKSTLLNLLVGDDRAIVTDIHGTTRDLIEDTAEIGGFLFRFIDTAGLRLTTDAVENLGIKRSYAAMEKAAIIVWLIDSTSVTEHIDWMSERILPRSEGKKLVLAFNKCDKISDEEKGILLDQFSNIAAPKIFISARDRINIGDFTNLLIEAAGLSGYTEESVLISNVRHYEALTAALADIKKVRAALADRLSGELLSLDLRDCLDHIGAVTGEIANDEVLGNIFAKFCIGK